MDTEKDTYTYKQNTKRKSTIYRQIYLSLDKLKNCLAFK